MHRKAVTLLLGAVTGIFFGLKSPYASELLVACSVLGLLFLFLLLVQRRRERDASFRFAMVPLFGGIFCFGLTLFLLRVQFLNEQAEVLCEKSCVYVGYVREIPKIQDAYQQIVVHDGSEKLAVLVRAPLYPRYSVGEELSLTGSIKEGEGISGTSTFDYASYLKLASIGSVMYYPKIERTGSTHRSLSVTLMSIREHVQEKLASYIQEPTLSLSEGMLFGNTSMHSDMKEAFRVSGLSHVVVLSGFNIALVISFVMVLGMFLPLYLRVVLTGVFVTLFVIMVGGGASVIRATLMSCTSLLALSIGTSYTSRQALVLSLLGILLYSPEALLYDSSLHLSFLATGGIVYLLPYIERYVVTGKKFFYRELIATTLSAYFATLPYVMYTFGLVSVYGLVANALLLPLVPLLMLLTGIVAVLSFFSGTLASVFGYLTTLLGQFFIVVVENIASLPYASLKLHISFFVMVLLYGILALVCATLSKKNKNETHETKEAIIESEIMSF
jgi:competence protein ComEC